MNPTAQLRCEDCHYWWPYHMYPAIGVCKHPKSPYLETVVYGAREPCQDFCTGRHRMIRKDVHAAEFLWCGTCRETLYRRERGIHRAHKVFTGVAVMPDAHEFTVAGD